MKRLVALVAALIGCVEHERVLQLVPALPDCVPTGINSVRLLTLGDFPPAPALTTATDPMGQASLSLPAGTRVLQIDGLGAAGLIAFGRTPPFDVSQLPTRVGLNYGPPDTLCAAAAMNYARAGHQATLLPSGSVLFSGGYDSGGFPVPKMELYLPFGDANDPRGRFRVVDPSGVTAIDARASLGHRVVPAGGQLLVTGGAPSVGGRPMGIASEGFTRHRDDGVRLSEPQILPGGPRAFHSATVLGDGSILLVGGCARFDASGCASDALLGSSVLFREGQWSDGPALLHPRFGHEAILRGDGKILVVGGGPAELLDPAGGGGDVLDVPGPSALMPTGALLSVSDQTVLWLEDETVPLSPLPSRREGHSLTALEDGAALVAGGGGLALAPELVLYDALGGIQIVPGPFTRREHSATRLGDGSILLAGGLDTTGATPDASVFLHSPLGPFSNLATLTFADPDAPLQPRRPDRTRIVDGKLELTDGIALLGALQLTDLQLAVTITGAGTAQLLFGWQSDARHALVTLTVGQPVTLSSLPGGVVCTGAASLEEADRARLTLNWRARNFEVFSTTRSLLRCTPDGIGRGAVGLGASGGSAQFDDVTLTR